MKVDGITVMRHKTPLDTRECDELRRPFYATGAELEFYQHAFERWRTLPADAVLTEAARLFNLAVAIANDGDGRRR